MRKKELLNQNRSLFEQLQKAKIEYNELSRIVDEKDAEITRLKGEIEKLSVRNNCSQSLRKIEDKIIYNAGVDDNVKYGSKVIGNIVIGATKSCNSLTNIDKSNEETKELVNLILGRTEVAKSEILGVVSSGKDFDEMKNQMNLIEKETLDYFESVLAQIN